MPNLNTQASQVLKVALCNRGQRRAFCHVEVAVDRLYQVGPWPESSDGEDAFEENGRLAELIAEDVASLAKTPGRKSRQTAEALKGLGDLVAHVAVRYGAKRWAIRLAKTHSFILWLDRAATGPRYEFEAVRNVKVAIDTERIR